MKIPHSTESAGLLLCILCLFTATALRAQDLLVDFTATGGPVADGYQGYFATQEQPTTFTPQSFAALGTTVTVTPTWAGTLTAGQNPQLIARGSVVSRLVGLNTNLLVDWIGTDARGSLVANDPMTLTLSGIPAGAFAWTSYHHDPDNQTEPFDLIINDAKGSKTIANIDITAGTERPISIVNTVIWSDGVNPITLVFDARVDSDFFLCNGFEIPDVNLDSDADGLLDSWEIDNFGAIETYNGTDDPDHDNATNLQEQDAGTDPNDPDADGDSLLDGDELAAGTDPANPDTDGDGRSDGEEVNGPIFSNPLLVDTDGDLINDFDEVDNGTDPQDPNDFPLVSYLQVDFSPNPNGPLELFYQPYLALHEINSLDSDPVGGDSFGVDRLNQPFAALGTTVNLSISYPDLDRVTYTEDQLKTVKQLIDRAAYIGNYSGTKSNLVQAWIGTDARTSSSGNGTERPTTLRMVLSGLPAGTYALRTYHHDPQNQAGNFGIRVTDADSTGVLLSTKFKQTTSTGSNNADPGPGNGPEDLRSTVVQVIRANGTDPVTVDFEKTAQPGSEFFVLNGFELYPTVDADEDDMIDDVETAFFGDTSRDGTGDFDNDSIPDYLEILLNLDPTVADTDGDGLDDGEELGSGAVAAPTITITSFGLDTATGIASLDWYPPVRADFEVRTNLTGTPVLIPAGVVPPFSIPIPPELSGERELYLRVVGPPAGIGTSPYIADTDGDGLKDGEEVNTYGTNPLDADSDDDGYTDLQEVNDASDPNDVASLPDQDGDGYSNAAEVAAGTNPEDPNDFPQPPANALFVDFNSNQDNGGDSSGVDDPALSTANHNQKGYQSYHANHEVAAEFSTAAYSAFGTTVMLTPSWPDTTDNRVEQSIDRGTQDAAGVVTGGNDANWKGQKINLITDWLGTDTRLGSGGNGDYDGTNGTPTRLDLTLEGLPAGDYSWRSYHHDTENVHSDFLVEISVTGAAGPFTEVTGPGPDGRFPMSNSTTGGTPPAPVVYQAYPLPGSSDPVDLPSTVNATFTANGSDPVIIRFTPLVDTGAHRQIWGINGFELIQTPP